MLVRSHTKALEGSAHVTELSEIQFEPDHLMILNSVIIFFTKFYCFPKKQFAEMDFLVGYL